MAARPHRRPRATATRRGQALVEFAIILPVIAMLLVMAVDFGRVFFGWVALNNAVRIAADRAAQAPDAWPATNNLDQQDQDNYRLLTIRDMAAINCEPPAPPDTNGIWDDEDIPDPTWVDVNGDGDDRESGDHAVVAMTCNFRLLTPLAEAILGGPVATTARGVFPIHEIMNQGLPDPPEVPCGAPAAHFSFAPDNRKAPVAVSFTDESTSGAGCAITDWEWDFGDGSPFSNAQSPVHTFTCSTTPRCVYTVSLTVTSSEGVDSFTDDVRVRP